MCPVLQYGHTLIIKRNNWRYGNSSHLTVACLIRRLRPPCLATKEDIYHNLSGNSCRVIKYKYFYFLSLNNYYFNLLQPQAKIFKEIFYYRIEKNIIISRCHNLNYRNMRNKLV